MLCFSLRFVEVDVWVGAAVKDPGKMVHSELVFKFVFRHSITLSLLPSKNLKIHGWIQLEFLKCRCLFYYKLINKSCVFWRFLLYTPLLSCIDQAGGTPGTSLRCGRGCLRGTKEMQKQAAAGAGQCPSPLPGRWYGAVPAAFSLDATLLRTKTPLVRFLVGLQRTGAIAGQRLRRCHSFASCYPLSLLPIIYRCFSVKSKCYLKHTFVLLALKKLLTCAGNGVFLSDWSWHLVTFSKIGLTRDTCAFLKKMNPLNMHTLT